MFSARGGSPLDSVETALPGVRLVALDEQEVRRAAASVLFRPGDVVRGVPLRVDGVGGDHGTGQVDAPAGP